MATLCSAAAWPLVVNAKQADKIYRLGYLGAAPAALMKALREGLAALGYIEGKNIIIEERRVESGYNKLQVAELAAQLVGLNPDVIVTAGPSAVALKEATTTIPMSSRRLALP